jgi:ribosomal protein S18 acetylase RimI-like enzyme
MEKVNFTIKNVNNLVLNTLFSSSPDLQTSGTTVTIRLAQLSDLFELSEIITHSFYPPHQLWRWVYPLLKLSIYEDLRQRLRSNSPEYFCFVATVPVIRDQDHQELLVGTVEIAIRSQLASVQNGKAYPYISNLAIHSHYRRQGIARQLLQYCEKTACEWGFEEICLHVLENNDPAQKLYYTNGYQLAQRESTMISWLLKHPKRCFLIKSLSSC